MKPNRYQNDTCVGSNMKLSLVSKRYPNNTNLNITNITATTKREKDAVAAVNFKKLKEEGEEKMQAPHNSKEHYTGQALRERMVELDFKEEFIEKILKEYSTKKIDEKLDLLIERRNIKNPAGWLNAALQNDYRDPHSPDVIANDRRECGNPVDTPEQISREAALKEIKLIQDNLSACISPLNERRFKCQN
jgi:hypothetical protein